MNENKKATSQAEYTMGEAKYRVTRLFGGKKVDNILLEQLTINNSLNTIEVAKK